MISALLILWNITGFWEGTYCLTSSTTCLNKTYVCCTVLLNELLNFIFQKMSSNTIDCHISLFKHLQLWQYVNERSRHGKSCNLLQLITYNNKVYFLFMVHEQHDKVLTSLINRLVHLTLKKCQDISKMYGPATEVLTMPLINLIKIDKPPIPSIWISKHILGDQREMSMLNKLIMPLYSSKAKRTYILKTKVFGSVSIHHSKQDQLKLVHPFKFY